MSSFGDFELKSIVKPLIVGLSVGRLVGTLIWRPNLEKRTHRSGTPEFPAFMCEFWSELVSNFKKERVLDESKGLLIGFVKEVQTSLKVAIAW